MSVLHHPTAYQERTLAVPETLNLALFGGRGGGKTTALVFLVVRHCLAYRGDASVLVCRATYRSLTELFDTLASTFQVAFPGSTSNRTDMMIRTPFGATVTLSNLSTTKDVTKLQGQSFTLFAVDEFTNFATQRNIDRLKANLRGPANVPTRIVLLGNPGGPLHHYVSKTFINGRKPWHPFALDDGSRWVLAPSTYRDNDHIDRDKYHQSLIQSAGGDRALASAWIDGEFAELAGAFFSDVWSDELILPDDPAFKVQKGTISNTGVYSAVGLDWGMSAPSVALLGMHCIRPAFGPGGRVFPRGSWIILDEVSTATPDDPNRGKGWPPQMLAEEILARCKSTGVRPVGVGDDARGLNNDTLLDQLRTYGLHLRKPTKDRISGWVRMKQLMAGAAKNDPDEPGLWITDRCRYLLETLPMLPRDDLRMEDLDTTAPDHGADAARYLVNTPPPVGRSGRVVGYY